MESLGHSFLYHQNEPIVLTNAIKQWKAAQWTPEILRSVFQDRPLSFRIGNKKTDDVEWETQCQFKEATMTQFTDRLNGIPDEQNPLRDFQNDNYWYYCDYKHMKELFGSDSEILQAVDWSNFGFPGRAGEKSTFWLGSEGAHTQCHYDTYGCNLVAQIYGRKKWVLFPPSQSSSLYPTRIPYEESSVFSNVNIACPNFDKFPRHKLATPTVIIMNPGDVLFVPNSWWHDVTSLETSISINSWIELPKDDHERINEAVTRCLIMAMMDAAPEIEDEHWLNPTEEHTFHEINLKYINESSQRCQEIDQKECQETDRKCPSSETQIPAKKTKIDRLNERKCEHGFKLIKFPEKTGDHLRLDYKSIQDIIDVEGSQMYKHLACESKSIRNEQDISNSNVTFETRLSTEEKCVSRETHNFTGRNFSENNASNNLDHVSLETLHLALVKSITHPDVIAEICKKMQETLCSENREEKKIHVPEVT